ncbi:MAG TPA: tetratricopeptide repeat protein, partial [Nevskiaceae bacterium]|nr:tetratricopeptide repeat protein [Nevskiaceae bacterium]
MTRSSKRLLAASLALMLAACAAAPMHTLPPPRNIAAPAAAPAAPADNSAAAEHRFRDALALMKDQQVDEAIAAFTALDHDFPAYSGAATNLGILYARRQQLARARGWFERAAAQNPRNVVALSWLGSTRRALGDFP